MNRKKRTRGVLWTMIIGAIFCFGIAFWMLTKPSIVMEAAGKYTPEPNYVPHMIFEDIPAYVLIGVGLLFLVLTPVAIKSANKKADSEEEKAEMKEMLEEYRRRKKQNIP